MTDKEIKDLYYNKGCQSGSFLRLWKYLVKSPDYIAIFKEIPPEEANCDVLKCVLTYKKLSPNCILHYNWDEVKTLIGI